MNENSERQEKPARPRASFRDMIEPREKAAEFERLTRNYPVNVRAALLERAKPMIFAGAKLDDVAAELGINHRTLDYWLAQMGDEYRQLRRAWIDSKLTTAEENLATAPDKLEVLRWKALMSVAQWYAERRDPERYAPKQEITHKDDEPRSPEQIKERMAHLEAKLGIKTIEHEPAEQIAATRQENVAASPSACEGA